MVHISMVSSTKRKRKRGVKMTCAGKTGFKYYPKNVADLKKKQRAIKKDIKARRKKK